MQQTKRKRQAQGRIDYIIKGNTPGVRQLIRSYGITPPKDVKTLTRAVKQVIREKGRPAIKGLIKHHPDRKIILRLEKEKDDNYCGYCGSSSYNPEDHYCGSCSHSNYDEEASGTLLDRLLKMNTDELEKYYKEVLEQANKSPQDTTLANRLQQVWSEMRQRKLQATEKPVTTPEQTVALEEKPKDGFTPEQMILILGLTLTAGVLVGVSIKIKGNG